MLIYLFVAVWPIFIMSLYARSEHILAGNRRLKKRYLLFAAIPMFLMIALRGEHMGADTAVYLRHFLEVRENSLEYSLNNTRMEYGYIVFVKLIGYLTGSPKIFQIICTLVYFIGFMSYALGLDGNDGFMFLFFLCTLGVFFFLFTGIRQCLAISVCLLAYQFLLKRRQILFLLLLTIAYTFHKSSLLFLFVLFLWDSRLKGTTILTYILVLYLTSRYLLDVQMWINELFDYDYEIENVAGGGIYLILLLVLTLFAYVVIKQYKDKGTYASALFNLNITTLFFWVLRLQTRVAERPSYYFLPFSCALFAFAFNKFRSIREVQLVRFLIIAVSLTLYTYRMTTNFASLIPYQVF